MSPAGSNEMTELNQKSWELMIDENIEWLLQQPRTLERDHIESVLRWTRKHKPKIPLTPNRDFYEEEQLGKLLSPGREQ